MFATFAARAARVAPVVAAAAVAGLATKSFATSAVTCDALSPEEFRPFTVAAKQQLTADTAEYTLAFPDGHLFDRSGMKAASYLLAKGEVGGKTVVRPYTPTSSPDDQGALKLVVKTYPDGKISKLIGDLRMGDALQLKGPFMKFEYKPNMKKYIGMVAGGSGITPMLQVIDAVLSNPRDNTEVRLIFANKTPADIMLKNKLDALAWKHANFKVVYTVDKGGDDWDGNSGFVTADMIRSCLPPPTDDSLILVCGPPAMQKALAGAKGKNYTQGELSGVLAHMGYTQSQVYKY